MVEDDEVGEVGRAWIREGDVDKKSAKVATIVSLSMTSGLWRRGGASGGRKDK